MSLFCFPYAGGTTSAYRNWDSVFPPQIEACPVELPGRAGRMSEAPATSIMSLVESMTPALLPYLDKPFAFFGHSMGALISFEFARELRRSHELTASSTCSSRPLALRTRCRSVAKGELTICRSLNS